MQCDRGSQWLKTSQYEPVLGHAIHHLANTSHVTHIGILYSQLQGCVSNTIFQYESCDLNWQNWSCLIVKVCHKHDNTWKERDKKVIWPWLHWMQSHICKLVLDLSFARGYHSSVTSLTSLSCRARHIFSSDEYLGDAMNEAMTEILTKRLHHDISSLAWCVTSYMLAQRHSNTTYGLLAGAQSWPKLTATLPSVNRVPK